MIFSANIISGALITKNESLIQTSAKITKVDPYHFDFMSDPEETPVSQFMREAQLQHVCDHLLTTGRYTLSNCPRCLSTGYFYDIQLDGTGAVAQITGSAKLQQELEKIVRTSLRENAFHIEYGFPTVTGMVNSADNLTFLKQAVLDAVINLQTYQEEAMKQNTANFSTEELINKIESIETAVDPADPQRVTYTVTLQTISGREPVIITGSI